jgi:dihydroneopterin aldolase
VADQKILAAQFYSPLGRNTLALDKISVRNLVLDCKIGVFEEEKLGTQRVRFSVEVSVYPRPLTHTDDVRHIVSYDMIVGGIRKVIAAGHINLLETLAERVAEECLADRRVAKVHILVEKLDRLQGASLGVEIERTRSAPDIPNIYALP